MKRKRPPLKPKEVRGVAQDSPDLRRKLADLAAYILRTDQEIRNERAKRSKNRDAA